MERHFVHSLPASSLSFSLTSKFPSFSTRSSPVSFSSSFATPFSSFKIDLDTSSVAFSEVSSGFAVDVDVEVRSLEPVASAQDRSTSEWISLVRALNSSWFWEKKSVMGKGQWAINVNEKVADWIDLFVFDSPPSHKAWPIQWRSHRTSLLRTSL